MNAVRTGNSVGQGCSHFFSLRATYKMTKSKWSTYYKNALHSCMNPYFTIQLCTFFVITLLWWLALQLPHSFLYPFWSLVEINWATRQLARVSLRFLLSVSMVTAERPANCSEIARAASGLHGLDWIGFFSWCHAIYPRYLSDRPVDRDRRIEHPCCREITEFSAGAWEAAISWSDRGCYVLAACE